MQSNDDDDNCVCVCVCELFLLFFCEAIEKAPVQTTNKD